MKYMLIIVLALVFVLLVAWTGLQVMPKGFTQELETVSQPLKSMRATSSVPVVSKFYETVFDGDVIETKTSVVAGKARFNIKGIPMKGRFITFYRASEGFYRYIEVTWFGIPILSGYDLYTEDTSEFCMGESVETGERIEQGQNLALWAESFWSPSMLVFSDAIEWQGIGERAAVMHIPYHDDSDTITITFEDEGLIEKMEALRFKGNSPEKTLWQIKCLEWADFDGITIPVKSSVKWGDEAKPWAYWEIDSIQYNIPVSEGFIDEMALYGKVNGK